jgi:hypothetical protein
LYSCISSWNSKVEGSYAYPVFCSRNFVFNSSLSGNHHQSIASLCRKNGNHPLGRFSQNLAAYKSEGSKFFLCVPKMCHNNIIFFY